MVNCSNAANLNIRSFIYNTITYRFHKISMFHIDFQYLATQSELNYTIYYRSWCNFFFKHWHSLPNTKKFHPSLKKEVRPHISLLPAHRSRCCCYLNDKTNGLVHKQNARKGVFQGKARWKGGLELLFMIYSITLNDLFIYAYTDGIQFLINCTVKNSCLYFN